MNRRLTTLLLAALTTIATPSVAPAADCVSEFPVNDKRFANMPCAGAHVGMSLMVPSLKYGDSECAASFAFKDQFGQRYVTSPGTCFLDYDCLEDAVYNELPPPLNEVVPRLPVCIMPSDSELEPFYKRSGPPVKNLDGRRVGAIVYAVNKNDVDFALVRIDKGVKLDPSLPVYGGPVKNGAAPAIPTEAYIYSNAMVPLTANARSGVLHGGPDFPMVLTDRFGAVNHGTSVMLPNGSAMGYFNGHLSIGGGYEVKPLGPALYRASRRTGLKLPLMTGKLK